MKTLLAVKHLSVEFAIGRRTTVQAVSDVSFELDSGETLGLVGESGCGKSTLARTIVGLQKPTSGRIFYAEKEISGNTRQQLRNIRSELQMIFQDAPASLNPGRKIGRTIEEPLRIGHNGNRKERYRKACAMMQAVGLDPGQMYARYPFELSGGQCQRVSLARALINQPRLLICDEPVSSLDVSVQAQIINLLEKMKQSFDLTILFISHDLAVVKNISDRVAVMYLGKFCEIASVEDLYHSPCHPYSTALLESIPDPDPGSIVRHSHILNGEMPSPAAPPAGCRFHTRCPHMRSICNEVAPELTAVDVNRLVACHFPR